MRFYFYKKYYRKRRPKKLPKYHAEARKLLVARTKELAKLGGFTINKVFVKHQKTRWGSCSSRGNINLNAKLVFLRLELRDYVIIHELCHLRHMNHSKAFWSSVQSYIPHAKALQKELRAKPYHELKYEGLKEAQKFATMRVVTYS